MFKEQKGITLVALVITIIVLLILAGVSISLVVGNNGILGKATHAVDENELATVRQEIELSVADAQIDYLAAKAQGSTKAASEYYTDASYYTANCTGIKAGTSITPTVDGTDIKLTYTAKSGTAYEATFSASNPKTVTVTKK